MKLKDSGHAWLGEIPESWSVKRMSDLYQLRNTIVSDKDYQPLSVTMKGIVPQLETAAKTNDGDNRKLVKRGDFVINSRSDRRGSCGISEYDGSVSLINTVLCPRENLNTAFYNWLLHSSKFADEFYRWGHGIVDDLWTTRWSEMRNIAVVFPDEEEQGRIAEFLDGKCGEIDELIRLQEEMVSKLEEFRKSVISETVLRGLNPDAPLRPSGIDWIGNIPHHWKIVKLKYLVRFNSGDTITALDFVDDGPYEVYGANGKRGHYSKFNYDGPRILVGRVGALCGNIHLTNSKIWVSEHALVSVNSHLIDFDYNWLSKLLEASNLNQYGGGSAQPVIASSTIENLPIVLPPLAEQEAIAEYLDKRCAEIDALIEVKRQKIDALKEYKKSVIYEYVTGKKTID